MAAQRDERSRLFDASHLVGLEGERAPEAPLAARVRAPEVTGKLGTTLLSALRVRGAEPEHVRWAPGQQVGPYTIQRRLGAGANGTCFMASKGEGAFQKHVCLKVLRRQYLEELLSGGEAATSAREMIRRAEDEACLQASLQHSHVIDVYDFRNIRGDYVIEMQLIDGLSLGELDLACGMSLERAAYIASQILCGAEWIHGATDQGGRPLGLVHRDLKPANVMVDKSGCAKIGDFGIAKGHNKKSHTGDLVIGTLRYMSPEQLRATARVDARSDLYSIGVIFHELLSGRKHPSNAHLARSDAQIAGGIVEPARVSVREHAPHVPSALGEVVDRLTAFRAEHRFQSAREALDALHAALPIDMHKQRRELADVLCQVLGPGGQTRPNPAMAAHPERDPGGGPLPFQTMRLSKGARLMVALAAISLVAFVIAALSRW